MQRRNVDRSHKLVYAVVAMHSCIWRHSPLFRRITLELTLTLAYRDKLSGRRVLCSVNQEGCLNVQEAP